MALKCTNLGDSLIETEAFTRHPSSVCGSLLVPEHLEREAGIDHTITVTTLCAP